MLGVNPATLRQWTATGMVQSYRTPGGHRRYRADEIASMSRTGVPASAGALATDLITQLRSRYRALGQSSATHQGWLASLDDASRGQFHLLGGELLDRLGDYLLSPSPAQRHRAFRRAQEIAREYARLAGAAGVGLPEAVEAYLRFRRPLLDVLARNFASHPELGSQLGHLMRDAERFMDGILAGMSSMPHVTGSDHGR